MANRQLDRFDRAAERESAAIKKAYHPHTTDFGCRLRPKYYIDGVPHLTGQKHRRAGHMQLGGFRKLSRS